MSTLIFLVLLGLGLYFLIPNLLRRFTQGGAAKGFDAKRYDELSRKLEQYPYRSRVPESLQDEWDELQLLKKLQSEQSSYSTSRGLNPTLANSLIKLSRVLGVIMLILAIVSTSAFYVTQGHSGHAKRMYFGDNMATGQIMADDDQNGPQKDLYAPGLHFEFMIRVTTELEYLPDIVVPDGHVLTLLANDGCDKPSDQYFANEWDTAQVDKKKMLEDAAYALERDANGNIMRLQKGPQVVAFPPGTYRFNQYLYTFDTTAALIDIQPGEAGIMKFNYGKKFDPRLLYDPNSPYFSVFPTKLLESDRPVKSVAIRAKLVPKGFKETADQPFDYAWLDDPESKWYQYFTEEYNELTKDMVRDAKLVPPGYIGVCWDALREGKYAYNPAAVQVYPLSMKTMTFNYWGGFVVDSSGIDFAPNVKIPEGAADVATDAISKDGFRMFIEYRALVKTTPRQAPYAFVTWGGWAEIENKAVTPDSRSVMRNNAQNAVCLQYFKDREEQESTTYAQMFWQMLSKGITTVDINFGEIRIDPKLLATQTRYVLAEQNKLAWQAEEQEQRARINTEEQKALADQQQELVKADIAKQRAEYYRDQKDLEGQGDANYAAQLSEGQKKLYRSLAEVIGPDNFARLEMLKVLKEMGVTNITPLFMYNGAGGSNDMGPLHGTMLSSFMMNPQMQELMQKSGLVLEDFLPAKPADSSGQNPDSTSVPAATTPTPAPAEPEPDSSKTE